MTAQADSNSAAVEAAVERVARHLRLPPVLFAACAVKTQARSTACWICPL